MSRFHNTPRWARLARAVKDRDGWRCRECGKSGRLEADHRVPISKTGAGLAGQWDPSNLQALCRNCHFKKSSKERRISLRGLETRSDRLDSLSRKTPGLSFTP